MPRKPSQRLPDPERVLAGRATVRIEQLFELIRQVNPTDSGLAGAERDAAYSVKARLQSLLIERFGEQLHITEVGGSEGSVIGIRHRTYDRDACHAVVHQLSEAARAWVRWQRDTAAEAVSDIAPKPLPTRPPAAPISSDEGLAAGERRLAEYDFDGARQAFEASLHSPVAAERARAARLLLILLVEHLADCSAAIALGTSLDVDQLADPDVRCLLAFAHATAGDHEEAKRLLGRLSGERADAAALGLAARALEAAELDECERWAERIPPASGMRPRAMSLLAAVRSRRAEAGRALEPVLRAAQASGDLAAIERAAHELLAVDPESAVGSAALRDVRTAVDARERATRLELVRRLLESGDLAGARIAHRGLPVGDGEAAELLAAIVAAEAQAHSAARDRQVATIVRQLEAGVDEAVVEAVWSCAPGVVEVVRSRVLHPAARWLFTFAPERGRGAAAAVAGAAVALAAASTAFESNDPDAARRHLVGHETTVVRSRAAKDLLARIDGALAEARRRAARQRLRTAAELAIADPAGALAMLRPIEPQHLDPEDRAQRERLLSELATRCAVLAAEQRVREALDRGDLFAARAETKALLSLDDSAARSTEVAELDRRIRSQWVETECKGEVLLSPHWRPPGSRDSCRPANGIADGIVVAEQAAGRVSLHELHPDHRTNRTWVVTPPEPFELLHTHVQGTIVWLVGRQSILHFDLATGRPVGLRRFEALERVRDVESALPIPGTTRIWVATRHGAWLVDAERWRIEKQIDECQAVSPLWGGSEPAVFYSRHLVDYVSASVDGSPIRRYRAAQLFEGATARPCGAGAAVLRKVWDGTNGAPMLRVGAILPQGGGFGEIDLGRVRANAGTSIVSSREADRVFVVAELLEGGRQLICVETGHQGVTEHWRLSLEGAVGLYGDCRGEVAHALHHRGEDVELVRLSATNPFAGAATRRRHAVTTPRGGQAFAGSNACAAFDCPWLAPELDERTAACRDLSPMLASAAPSERIAALLDSGLDLLSVAALHRCGLLDGLDEAVIDRAVDPARSPAHALLCAEIHAGAGRIQQSLTHLVHAVDAAPGAVRQHALHVRALCRLILGDDVQARVDGLLADGIGEGECRLQDLRDFLARGSLPGSAAAAGPGGRSGSGRTATTDPVLALADSDDLPDPVPLRVLRKGELGAFFDGFVAALCSQAERCWASGNHIRLMGVVMSSELPAARALAVAGEQLLGIRQEGDYVVLALPLAAAVRRIARWPIAIATLLSRTVFEGSYRQFPLVVVRSGEIGFGNITA